MRIRGAMPKAGEWDELEDPAAIQNLSPEQRLAHATLVNAVRDYFKHPQPVIRKRTKIWLMSNSNHLFGARWWSEVADLEDFLTVVRRVVNHELGDPITGAWFALWEYRDGKEK